MLTSAKTFNEDEVEDGVGLELGVGFELGVGLELGVGVDEGLGDWPFETMSSRVFDSA